MVELIYGDLIGQGFTVWFDKENIRAGDEWPKQIQEGIDNSTLLVVVWNENASKSEWVQRELTRADSQNMPIIPLRFDDTDPTITIQNHHHIDARNGFSSNAFPMLVSRLRNYIDSEPLNETQTNLAWQYCKKPFFRSPFLEENGYRDVKSANFAVNDATNMLRAYSGEPKPDRFVTLVSIPVSDTLDVELEQAIQVWQNCYSMKHEPDTPRWQKIENSDLNSRHKTQQSITFYDNRREISNLETWSFMKFDMDGAIEFGNYINFVFDQEDRQGIRKQSFRLLPIMGAAWKLIYFSAHYYQRFSYDGRFHFLISFRNTNKTILDGFADGWVSTISEYFSAYNQGVAHDDNLQFICDIDVRKIVKKPSHIENIIADLSRKIQWAFNLDYQPRHNLPDTEDFDWRSYPRNFL